MQPRRKTWTTSDGPLKLLLLPGLAGCLLVILAWIASISWWNATLYIANRPGGAEVHHFIMLAGGCISILAFPDAGGFSINPQESQFEWGNTKVGLRRAMSPAEWSKFRRIGLVLPGRRSDGSVTRLPLWLIFAVVAAPTAFLWYRDRLRRRPGHCKNCNYNLTGNTSGICPECGTPIPEKESPTI